MWESIKYFIYNKITTRDNVAGRITFMNCIFYNYNEYAWYVVVYMRQINGVMAGWDVTILGNQMSHFYILGKKIEKFWK